jgi:hypothetical protein
VTFAHEQGAYLVGAVAALETETGRIGYIGANASPFIEEFRAGFEQGAAAVASDVDVISSLIRPEDLSGTQGYQDRDAAREIAEWMYRVLDVDVIFTAAGGSNLSVIAAADELSDVLGQDLWVVGVDDDTAYRVSDAQAEHVLTSMVKHFDVGIDVVVDDYVAGELRMRGEYRLGVADGAVGYTTTGGHLAPATVSEVEAHEAALRDGGIVVDDEPSGPRSAPPRPEAPDSPATRAALDVVERYFGALQARDADAAVGLVHADADVSFYRPMDRDTYAGLLVMDAASGTSYLDVDCRAVAPATGPAVDCSFGLLDGVARFVDGPVVPETATFVVDDGSITALTRAVGEPDHGLLGGAFASWMQAHGRERLDTDLWFEFDDLDAARELGEERARLGGEWAAFLDAEGCTWDQGC